MKEISSRAEIALLVNTFYAEIKKDPMLGPIFNKHIAEEQWPKHLETLTDFWETNLFGVAKFKGNPTLKHFNVDMNLPKGIKQEHFGKWLQLWFQTIDKLFVGELAHKAKEAARRMAHGQFMAVWNKSKSGF